MKRIITIQDISCVGKCSGTVALPILSAAGVEAAILPTAVLSTHTAFPLYTFHDLTDQFQPIMDVFSQLGFTFDAIYTGYLGSIHQIDLVEKFFEKFGSPDVGLFVDPALGDAGKLYKGFTREYVHKMEGLCQKADLILPNLTEAALLLNLPYREEPTEAEIQDMLHHLADKGVRRCAITGVGFSEKESGFYLYDAVENSFYSYFNRRLPVHYHSTGDVFASCTVAGWTRGMSIPDALSLAVDFTLEAMEKTYADPEARLYGINFEEALPMLIRRLGL